MMWKQERGSGEPVIVHFSSPAWSTPVQARAKSPNSEGVYHGWWNGVYNPHQASCTEMYDRYHYEHDHVQEREQEVKKFVESSYPHHSEAEIEEWGLYRRKKSFLTELGGADGC